MPWALRQSSFTSIQQADVDGARTFREVGDELRTFAVPLGLLGGTMTHDSLIAMLALLAALPYSKACYISMPGNGMPAYMTIDLNQLSKR